MAERKKIGFGTILMVILAVCVVAYVVSTMRTAGDIPYSELRQYFLEEKVQEFSISDTRITAKLKGGSTVTSDLYDFDLFYQDLNDLVQKQYDSGIITAYNYHADHSTNWLQLLLPYVLAFLGFILLMNLMNRMAGGGAGAQDKLSRFGEAKVSTPGEKKVTFQRCGRGRRGEGGAAGDRGVPPGAPEVSGPGGAHPQGRAAGRPSGHRQDPAGQGGGRGGGSAVSVHLRLGLCGDVCGRGRQPCAGPVRAGQEERPGHHLHRRDRRRGPPARQRSGRRTRRAGADPEPAAGGDGRLRLQRGRGGAGRHQPAWISWTPRCCARAGSTGRSMWGCRTSRAGRRSCRYTPRNKPLAEDVDLAQIARGTAGFTGADLENLLNEAALLAGRRGPGLHHHEGSAGVHHQGHRRAGEAQPGHPGAGAAADRLSRGGTRRGDARTARSRTRCIRSPSFPGARRAA